MLLFIDYGATASDWAVKKPFLPLAPIPLSI